MKLSLYYIVLFVLFLSTNVLGQNINRQEFNSLWKNVHKVNDFEKILFDNSFELVPNKYEIWKVHNVYRNLQTGEVIRFFITYPYKGHVTYGLDYYFTDKAHFQNLKYEFSKLSNLIFCKNGKENNVDSSYSWYRFNNNEIVRKNKSVLNLTDYFNGKGEYKYGHKHRISLLSGDEFDKCPN